MWEPVKTGASGDEHVRGAQVLCPGSNQRFFRPRACKGLHYPLPAMASTEAKTAKRHAIPLYSARAEKF